MTSLELFVSGRLCLLGEHTDWAGEHAGEHGITPGRCLVVGTQEGLHASVTRLEEKVLRVVAHDDKGQQLGPWQVPLDPPVLLAEARKGGFWSYIAGTAYRVCLHHTISGGLEILNHTTTLPLSKGLSSSAAVCVLTARAFNLLYHLHLSTRGEMEFAYLGEVTTPSKCGRMDQGCAYGSVPIAMTFDRDILMVDRVDLAAPLHLVLVDLGASKCTTTILQSLQAHYPTPLDHNGERLQQLLGEFNLRVTADALSAMAAGNLQQLGALMREAQAEFDAAAGAVCPQQLAAPVLHQVLQHPPLQELVWGAKGVGSQGDGTAQLLCKGRDAQQQVCDIIQRDFRMHCLPLTVAPTTTRQQQQQTAQVIQQQQRQQQQQEEHAGAAAAEPCAATPELVGDGTAEASEGLAMAHDATIIIPASGELDLCTDVGSMKGLLQQVPQQQQQQQHLAPARQL